MNKLFSTKRLISILILIIVMFGLIAVSIGVRKNKDTPPVIQQIGNDSLGVVNRVLYVPASAVSNTNSNFNDLLNTYNENQHLKTKVDELNQDKVELETVKRENKSLKKQIKVNKTVTDYSKISAAVMSRSPDDWQNELVINKGSNSGLKKNMPVMAGSGLVGRLSEVNKTNSKVELISSNNEMSNKFASEIDNKNKEITGIIDRFDDETGCLVMTHVTSLDSVKPGQKVITSGMGGITPKGLLIGKVIKVKRDDYGLSKSVYVKPAAKLNNFTVVSVIDRDLGDK